MTQQNTVLPPDFEEWHIAERRSFLRENADEIRNQEVRRPLSREEVSDAEKKLAIKSLELRRQKKKYEEVKKEWRENTINPLKEEVSDLLDTLENKAELVEGEVYYIRDQQQEMVYGFLPTGQQVDRRPMLHEEKQTTIHSSMRKVDGDNQ